MTLYSCEVFLEVVNSGSFVNASESLNLSPSAVSHTIKGLEEEYGFSLFVRNRAGAVLTENGMRILPFIRAVLSSVENLEQEANRIKNHDIGTVKIALFSSVASNWFIKILHSFKQKYPDVDVIIYQGSYSEVINWIQSNAVDIAFTTDEMTKDMSFIPLKSDPLICLTPQSYLPKNKFSITVDDLKENNLIINTECKSYDAKAFLDEKGIPIGTYYDVIEHQTLFAMVREGMGLCIVPELVALSAPSDIKKFPIIGNPSRMIGISFPDSTLVSPLANLMKDEIVSFVSNL